jgi:hypothetical protein
MLLWLKFNVGKEKFFCSVLEMLSIKLKLLFAKVISEILVNKVVEIVFNEMSGCCPRLLFGFAWS